MNKKIFLMPEAIIISILVSLSFMAVTSSYYTNFKKPQEHYLNKIEAANNAIKYIAKHSYSKDNIANFFKILKNSEIIDMYLIETNSNKSFLTDSSNNISNIESAPVGESTSILNNLEIFLTKVKVGENLITLGFYTNKDHLISNFILESIFSLALLFAIVLYIILRTTGNLLLENKHAN